ncbi:MAG TPA: hypothetical protein VLT36_16160 [Candidatus Dormibacteraeota bacterium]|nr:hypothetical protein [Candidatus Dormibacteraeota bacterium]
MPDADVAFGNPKKPSDDSTCGNAAAFHVRLQLNDNQIGSAGSFTAILAANMKSMTRW